MSVILGGLCSYPYVQCTVELNNLSTAMGGVDPSTGVESIKALRKDYTNSTHGDWLDGYYPYVNYIGSSLGSSSLTQQIQGQTLTTVTAGHIAHSYLYDFYFRIHIYLYTGTSSDIQAMDISTLYLGNILSTQIKQLEIWNSYFIPNTLAGVDQVGLSDLNLTSPNALPHTYNPLEYNIFNLSIPSIGFPSINGSYSFNFDTETVTLPIVGQRIILWPFSAFNEFTETREWVTDVIGSIANETRIAIREIPIIKLEYGFIFKTTTEYTYAKLLARTIANLQIALPLWTDITKLTGLVSGQSTITINTTYFEFAEGSNIVFYKDVNTWEVQNIKSLTSTSITLTQNLSNSYPVCYVLPVYIGYVGSIDLKTSEGDYKTGNISLISTNPYNNTTVGYVPYFLNLPVWDSISIVTGGIENKYSRAQETITSPSSDIEAFDIENYNRENTQIRIGVEGHNNLHILRRKFDYLQGKFSPFWLPSFKSDFNPLTVISSGTSTVKIVYTYASSYPPKYIRIIGTDGFGNTIFECFTVSGVSNNGDGTETISFAAAATITFNTILQIQNLIKVRLDSDSVEYQHIDKNHTIVNVTVTEVLS